MAIGVGAVTFCRFGQIQKFRSPFGLYKIQTNEIKFLHLNLEMTLSGHRQMAVK